MKLLPQPDGSLQLRLDLDEAALLGALTGQLIDLLRSHSGSALDPDPLFASLEVGGSDTLPDDPALARLFPDAYQEEDEASEFRRVTEQGLLNRKLQDALLVTEALGVHDPFLFTAEVQLRAESDTDSGSGKDAGSGEDTDATTDVTISATTLPAWARTLTALRLAIAARIGLDDESDHDRLAGDSEARSTVYVFDWLAAILDSVLRMISQPDT